MPLPPFPLDVVSGRRDEARRSGLPLHLTHNPTTVQTTVPQTTTASPAAQQQEQHAHGVPANAAVVEDAGITPEIELQEGDSVTVTVGEVAIDETKLGSKLLVAGKEEKGLGSAWQAVVGVAGSWAKKAAPPASDAECDWSWSQLACSPTDGCHFKYKVRAPLF